MSMKTKIPEGFKFSKSYKIGKRGERGKCLSIPSNKRTGLIMELYTNEAGAMLYIPKGKAIINK